MSQGGRGRVDVKNNGFYSLRLSSLIRALSWIASWVF